jgi:peptide-methionine (R)-S-oxide reductase
MTMKLTFPMILALCVIAPGCSRQDVHANNTMTATTPVTTAASMEKLKPEGDVPDTSDRVVKTEEEWKKILSPEVYKVMREQATELACSGATWKNKEQGIYYCAACGNPLYSSETKFESGTGWPSFWEPIEPGRVCVRRDTSFGMVRDEIVCNRCGGHLGHVFDDGPEPTGQRYCMNSLAMEFRKQ